MKKTLQQKKLKLWATDMAEGNFLKTLIIDNKLFYKGPFPSLKHKINIEEGSTLLNYGNTVLLNVIPWSLKRARVDINCKCISLIGAGTPSDSETV